jgi:hypothetical protein
LNLIILKTPASFPGLNWKKKGLPWFAKQNLQVTKK